MRELCSSYPSRVAQAQALNDTAPKGVRNVTPVVDTISGVAFISVIVCSHNPRPDCLRRTLNSIKGQTLGRDHWELVVVDNGSNTSLSDTCDLSWHRCARHVREEELGLTLARLRAIAESRGELLVFVDDDNVLASGFLEEASTIHDQYPFLGVFGAGSLEPDFEIHPPPEIRSRLGLLALRSILEARWSNNVRDVESIPWGAGLCVSRRVADAYALLVNGFGSKVIAVLGRRGSELFSGEDDIFSWVAASVGLGFGVFPQLQLTHLISADRLSRSYFLRLIHDHTVSHSVRQYMLTGTRPRSIDALRYVHLLLHGVRNGRFSMQCQWAESRGEDDARRLICQEQLRPVELRDFVDADLAPSVVVGPNELPHP
jgi:glycosyltransferase involved in cell wall biosynthesis